MTASPSSSSPQMWTEYEVFLAERWPQRLRRLSGTALMGSGLLLLLDVLQVRLGAVASPRGEWAIASVRLGCLLPPLATLLLQVLAPRWRVGRQVGVGLLSLWLLASQASFYFVGTQRTLPHATLLLVSLLVTPLVLPLLSMARGVFYVLVFTSYTVMELTLDPARPLAPRLLGIATLGLGTLAIALSLEQALRTLRRLFFLKREMGSAARTLEASRAQVSNATETMGSLVEKLRDSTLELSSDSSRARMETERIAQASEIVARMARDAAERAAGATRIVSQATGHTERIDAQMERVESGMSSIGKAIGHTETSLRELASHARQIIAFTNTLQEFGNQTDVLALNAAMEAARAGDAGRSFAVVAREVRKLAEASKSSSVKINDVVRGIREQLDSTLQGMGAIRENTLQFETHFADARQTLASIREIVTRIEQMMRSTVEDAQEQAGATGAIFSGAAQLQELIQTHARMSMGVAVTADQLSQLADTLRTMVPKPASPPPPPAPEAPASGPASLHPAREAVA